MKTKNKFSLLMMLLLLTGVMSSCTLVYDYKISEFENSIEKLDANYKEYSPEKLRKEIENCEKQLEQLSRDNSRYTETQKHRISNLKGKYHRLLFEIKLYAIGKAVTDEGRTFIEYLKGLLGGISIQLGKEGLNIYENDSVPGSEKYEDAADFEIKEVNDTTVNNNLKIEE